MRLSKHAEQLVTEFLVDFFKALDENPEIQVAYTDGDPYINVTGLTGNGTFLTRDQMCLSALQHIVNVVAHKDHEGVAPGIVTVDVDGYVMRQREMLKRMAIDAALRVKREKQSVMLQPMSAKARRIIHVTLKDYPGITTHSEGRDPQRRVIVELSR
ncbi:MAG TPA: R3H domain-containing nucleic acid-binding protein [Clostridia bacterium]|nr:R3H domain-containing nucleic acid-binding protein [Clostridia bacterium]